MANKTVESGSYQSQTIYTQALVDGIVGLCDSSITLDGSQQLLSTLSKLLQAREADLSFLQRVEALHGIVGMLNELPQDAKDLVKKLRQSIDDTVFATTTNELNFNE